VPLVSKPLSRACRAERLAWAGAGPNRSSVTPSSASQGKRPAADAGKEVALRVATQVVRLDILDAPFIYIAGRDLAGLD
jgi:hypothetical protein